MASTWSVCGAFRSAASVVLAVSLLGACASVPPASVQLSEQIGADIEKSRSAHLSTLDAFYDRLLEENDTWVTETFLPRYIDNYQQDLAKACTEKRDTSPDCAQLGTEDIKVLVEDTVKYRDDLQRALAKSHNDAAALVGDHYADLATSNAAITALLASAVSVKEATDSAARTLSEVTGLEIDFGAIEAAFDDHLNKAGQAGESVAALEQDLADILQKAKQ